MKKVVLSAVAALAVTAGPAFAADMPAKAAYKAAPVAYVCPWDVAFGTAFTTDYVLRGISQSDNQGAVQGYSNSATTSTPSIQLYAGVWASSLATYIANAEFDFSGGARFSYGIFGLDLGYVYYVYPGGLSSPGVRPSTTTASSMPSRRIKFTDWLTLIGGTIIGGDNFNNYPPGASTTPVVRLWPCRGPCPGITTSLSAEIGYQDLRGSGCNRLHRPGTSAVAFNYKAITLDLRYYDTDLDRATTVFSPARPQRSRVSASSPL